MAADTERLKHNLTYAVHEYKGCSFEELKKLSGPYCITTLGFMILVMYVGVGGYRILTIRMS
jgi:hypothetical protein